MRRIGKINFILVFIIVFAVFLRFWNLDKIPTGVSNDELGFF